jgi:hypothetical protein
MTKHKKYYKGEGGGEGWWVRVVGKGGGFPQVQAIMNLVSMWVLVPHPCTKSAPTMH